MFLYIWSHTGLGLARGEDDLQKCHRESPIPQNECAGSPFQSPVVWAGGWTHVFHRETQQTFGWRVTVV